MKEDFISDKRRISYLSATYSRIYRGHSVLIEGDFGAGKTKFLQLLRPKKLHAIWVESLFNIHETLASILRELKYAWTLTKTDPLLLTKIDPLIANAASIQAWE